MDRTGKLTAFRSFAIALYVLGVCLCAWGFTRFESNMEDVFQWLPDETPERQTYDQFVRQFGVDDFLIVTWPELTIADTKGDRLANALEAGDQHALVDQAISGRQLIQRLIKQPRESARSIVSRFKGIYFGPDGRTTCVMVVLTEKGMDDRGAAVAFVKETAAKVGIAADKLILAGYPQVGAYGDTLIRNSILDFVAPSCLIATLVAWVCLRSLQLTFAIFAISGLAAGLSVAVVTLSGARWGALSSVIPTLAYILTLSGALHLVSYSRSRGSDRLFFHVLKIGWKPCALSCLTTAVGMLSLCRSDFPAIREFGVFCASGVLVSLICQLVFVPCAIDWIESKNAPLVDTKESRFVGKLLPRSGTIVVLFVSLTVFAGAGLRYLDSNLEVERNFASSTRLMKDIEWFEKNIGAVEQSDLLIKFVDVNPQDFDQRMKLIRQIETQLVASPHVATTLSVAAWLPDEPTGRTVRATAARAAYRTLVTEARSELTSTSYLRINGNAELWRISVRFPFLEPSKFTVMKTALPRLANEMIEQHLPGQSHSVEHTGVSLLYYIAQDQLINDLYRNFAFAFVMICPLMILVLQSFKLGLVAMIPNLCPAAVAYGLLGWFGYPLDLGMSIVACVALGIAVDDTTHFMLRFQDLRAESGGDTDAAINRAFCQCSRAMLHTTLITGFGLIAFLYSEFSTMTRFASLLIALVSIALVCDLVLLPALLKRFAAQQNSSE